MRKVGRPRKIRLIKHDPQVKQFSPRGRPGRPDEVELSADEFEAIRLADNCGLGQSAAAESMGISQQTFSRALRAAHKKISAALVEGKIIRVTEESNPAR